MRELVRSHLLFLCLALGCQTPGAPAVPVVTGSAVPASKVEESTPTPVAPPRRTVSASPQRARVQLTPEEYQQKYGFEYGPYLADMGQDNLTDQADFGVMQQGAINTLDFPIRNSTDQTLELGPPLASTGCCFSGELSNQLLEPGDEVTLTVTINSVHQNNDVHSNIVVPFRRGPESGAFLYRVMATVTPVIELEPGYLTLDGASGEFRVKSQRFQDGLKITKVETQPEGISVVPGQVESNVQTFRVELPELPELTRGGSFRLHTNDRDVPDVVLGWVKK